MSARSMSQNLLCDVTHKLFPEQQPVGHELASPYRAALLRHLEATFGTVRHVVCLHPQRPAKEKGTIRCKRVKSRRRFTVLAHLDSHGEKHVSHMHVLRSALLVIAFSPGAE